MQFRFVPMNEHYAEESMRWVYDGVFAVFGHDPDNPEDLAELAPASWPDRDFAVLDEHGEFVGIFNMDTSEGWLTIELYLRPDLTGRGLGEMFLRSCLVFAMDDRGYHGEEIRLRVGDFNRRATRLYEGIGFRTISSRMRRSSGPVEHELLGDAYLEHEMALRLADFAR
jgi:ribosomal protein S18 acetylase RimI-like enzyme